MDIFLATLFIVVCVLLIVVVLLQKGRGGGLGGVFGGAGSSAFGTRTGDVFTWVTIVLTALFLLLSIGTTFVYRPPRGTTATPVLTPPPGPIAGPTNVRIECDTANAVIRYSLDGSDVTAESPKLEKTSVTVNPGTTLKVQAFYQRWHPSEQVVAYYGPAETQPAGETLPATQAQPGGEAPAAETQPAEPPAPGGQATPTRPD